MEAIPKKLNKASFKSGATLEAAAFTWGDGRDDDGPIGDRRARPPIPPIGGHRVAGCSVEPEKMA